MYNISIQLFCSIFFDLVVIISDIPVQTVEYFDSEYDKLLKTDSNEAINLGSYIDDSQETFLYAYHCHEGMLTLAYALNKTIAGMDHNH